MTVLVNIGLANGQIYEFDAGTKIEVIRYGERQEVEVCDVMLGDLTWFTKDDNDWHEVVLLHQEVDSEPFSEFAKRVWV